MPYEYQDGDKWVRYDDATNEKMISNYRRNNFQFTVNIRGVDYNIDLNAHKQTRADNTHRFRILRWTQDNIVVPPSSKKAEVGNDCYGYTDVDYNGTSIAVLIHARNPSLPPLIRPCFILDRPNHPLHRQSVLEYEGVYHKFIILGEYRDYLRNNNSGPSAHHTAPNMGQSYQQHPSYSQSVPTLGGGHYPPTQPYAHEPSSSRGVTSSMHAATPSTSFQYSMNPTQYDNPARNVYSPSGEVHYGAQKYATPMGGHTSQAPPNPHNISSSSAPFSSPAPRLRNDPPMMPTGAQGPYRSETYEKDR